MNLNIAHAGKNTYEAAVRALRRPLQTPADPARLMRELVRCATLAANSHNTQPWKFALSPAAIAIRPDFTRRTPAVDPDDHHLWVSLGCATENLVLAAAALGKRAHVGVGPREVRVALENAAPVGSALVDSIFERQCTRAEYDAQPLPNDTLDELERAAARRGVNVLLLTERAKIEGVLEHVIQGNSAQMRDTAFVQELKDWIRFSEAEAVATADGLFARSSENPTLPRWLGKRLFSLFFTKKSENDKYAKQLRSSQFAQWLGLGSLLPDLIARFGRGPLLPHSLRRPVAQVIV